MLIESAEVRCFRTIGHVKLAFTTGLNVVYGENDTGKSTLMEAVRTCLTVPHRTTGATLEAMQSRRGGIPEVTVMFRRDGKTYEMHKTYGKGASARLEVRGGGRTIIHKSDAAETELRRVLGIESTSARKLDLGILPLLWVRQGQSGALPDLQEGGAAVQLGERLRAMSGEVMGGASGEKLFSRIAQAHGETYTSRDRPAANKPLALATAAQETALAAVRALEERRRAHEEAAEQFDRAQNKVHSVETALPDLAKNAETAERELSVVKALIGDRKTLVAEHERAKMSMSHAAEHGRLRQSMRERARVAQDELDKCGAAHSSAVARCTAAASDLEPAEQAVARAEKVAQGNANAAVSAQNVTRAILSRRDYEAIAAQLAKARACHAEVLETTRALAVEPIDDERLRMIEAQHQELEVATAKLEVSATAMELRALSGIGASLDGERLTLVPGEPFACTIAKETVLRIADLVEVKIQPGGEDLAARRQSETDARLRLEKAFTSAGARDLAEVRSRAANRKETAQKRKVAEEMLTVHAPAGLEALESELAALEARLAAVPLEMTRGLDLADAQEAERTAQAALESARTRTATAREHLHLARTEHERARDHLQVSLGAVTRITRDLQGAKAELSASISAHGDDDEVLVKHALAVGLFNEVRIRLDAIDAQLSPNAERDAEENLQRARRALRAAQTEREENNGERLRLAERLQAQDMIGLDERLAAARVCLAAANADLHRETQQGEALKLLLRIVTEERSNAHFRLEAPLRAEIEGLLRVLSPGSEVELGEGYAVRALRRAGDGRHDFNDLGFGSREQLAILVRLAAARVLRNGEPLCVMLDDAIVFSSETRFDGVLRMLVEAARELQIIVLTCHWDRYRELGAENVIDLERARLDQEKQSVCAA